MKWVWCMVGASLVGSVACRTPSAGPADGPLDTRAVEVLPPLSLNGDWAADQVSDVLWQQTTSGDEWAALELAKREGSRGLLAQLQRGGPGAVAAARAWPHVPEAWGFRGDLCEHAARYPLDQAAILLRALGESAQQRDTFGEELEPETVDTCTRWLSRTQTELTRHDEARFDATRDALALSQAAFAPPNAP